MAVRSLKRFQAEAVESAIQLFSYVKTLLDTARDPVSRADAITHNGFLLLEAPTGSGKTLIAGHIAEQFSHLEDVVWFWFAPFKGVVGQTEASLREEFAGLRLRDLQDDRDIASIRRGDVFVTTWQTVATRAKDKRNVRKNSEAAPSVDELVKGMREKNLRIGVVVDEAHHGFHSDTLASAFFKDVLSPEYAVLVTATPDDADIRDFEKQMGIAELKRTSISRYDVVESGLIKHGVKCIAYLADEDKKALVDFEITALRDGVACHRRIKDVMTQLGVSLTPLLMVQVDQTPKSVERAVERLKALGFADGQIAVHTAEEPDADILALANDESKEVLVFKMAVALGFDAPRAFTLVSMRASRDPDFGVQLVGRILRVHRRLQGVKVPEVLKYGYVFLADAESQTGIDSAGQRINHIKTEYAKCSPTTALVNVGGTPVVQVLGPGGQTFLFRPADGTPATQIADPTGKIEGSFVLQALFPSATAITEESKSVSEPASETEAAARMMWGKYRYQLKADIPRSFLSQQLPEDPEATEAECAAQFMVSARDLLTAIAGRVQVSKRTLDVFTHQLTMELMGAAVSQDQVAREALRVLLKSKVFHAKELRRTLVERLKSIVLEEALDGADQPERINYFLDVILATHPQLLYEAQRRALAKHTQMESAEPLPEELVAEEVLTSSRLNVYGVFPEDLNSWERAFAEFLDRDSTGTVLWWHRNPCEKPWSVRVLLSDGRGFYPDFVISVKGRSRQDGILLADTKYGFELGQEVPKILAEHVAYGRTLIIHKTGDQQWHTVRIDENGRPKLGSEFRIADTPGY